MDFDEVFTNFADYRKITQTIEFGDDNTGLRILCGDESFQSNLYEEIKDEELWERAKISSFLGNLSL